MARRITQKTPDSLVKAKQQELQAKTASEVALREATEISGNIERLKKDEVKVVSELGQAKESLVQIKTEIDSAEQKLSEVRKELSYTRGELSHTEEELVIVRQLITDLKKEQSELRKALSASHKQKVGDIAKAQLTAEEQKKVTLFKIEQLSGQAAVLENRIIELKAKEEEYNQRLVPKKSEIEEVIKNLSHEVLVVELEVVEANKKLDKAKSELYKETELLKEAIAKRLQEEQAFIDLRTKIAEQEKSVEEKTQVLRKVQEGVNQSLARLERDKADFELKRSLAQGKVTDE